MSSEEENMKEQHPYGIPLPAPLPWRDRGTTFTIGLPGPAPRSTVSCRQCANEFLLSDYLQGELNEEQCPACNFSGPAYKKKGN